MEAILLVGGMGTRLLPLTKTVPKPLIPLANVPFVDRTIRWLADAGIDHVILCVHYNAELFREYFAAHRPESNSPSLSKNDPLGTGGAIKNCESLLRAPRCLVFNGDIFTNLHLPEMLAAHRRAGAQVSIALTEVEDPSRYRRHRDGEHGANPHLHGKAAARAGAQPEYQCGGVYLRTCGVRRFPARALFRRTRCFSPPARRGLSALWLPGAILLDGSGHAGGLSAGPPRYSHPPHLRAGGSS